MTNTPSTRYLEARGRRKTAVARVRLTTGAGTAMINEKKLEQYFQLPRDQRKVWAPFTAAVLEPKKYNLSVHVVGGGISAQAEAVRHGVARAIVLMEASSKVKLRAAGYLTRDSRMVERKHYGLKKSRRAPSWSKR